MARRLLTRLTLFITFAAAAAASAGDYEGAGVAGDITEDVTWSGDVYLPGDLYIAPGATLTLGPGTRVTVSRKDALSRTFVRHGEHYDVEVTVAGALKINGAQDAPVIFVPASDGSPDDAWAGFALKKGGTLEAETAWLVGARRPLPPAAALSEDVYAVTETRKWGSTYTPYWGRDGTGKGTYFYVDGTRIPKEVIRANRGYSRWIIAPSVASASLVLVALASLGDIDVNIKTSDFIVNLRWAIPVGVFALGYLAGNGVDTRWGARRAQDKWFAGRPDFAPPF
jgi:hypothetical protein